MYTIIANSIIKAMWLLLPTLCAKKHILGESVCVCVVCGVDCVCVRGGGVCVWSVCVRGGRVCVGGGLCVCVRGGRVCVWGGLCV